MRVLCVRFHGELPSYCTAEAAIEAAKADDRRLRTVADEDVRGRVINDVCWSDAALTLCLDNGTYLNFVAQPEAIVCSLDQSPAVEGSLKEHPVIMLAYDGSESLWDRGALAERCVGGMLKRLWFGWRSVYVYIDAWILLCTAWLWSDDDKPVLDWDESQ
jgi:hypothetical protein